MLVMPMEEPWRFHEALRSMARTVPDDNELLLDCYGRLYAEYSRQGAETPMMIILNEAPKVGAVIFTRALVSILQNLVTIGMGLLLLYRAVFGGASSRSDTGIAYLLGFVN
jgi:hypothetical protein